MLVTAEWLIGRSTDPAVRIVDPRPPGDYAKGHIPGAVSAHTPYKDPDHPLHVMPPDQAERAIRGLGISNDSTVIVSGINMLAGRAWWFLRYHGHTDVRILDGGFDAYALAGGLVSTDTPDIVPGTFRVRPDPTLIARADDIRRELGSDTRFLDVRSDAEWHGLNIKDHTRIGHIPGARHLAWDLLLETEPPHHFQTPDRIRALATERGLRPDDRVVTVCEVGWRAAHTAFALRLAGFADVRVYDASMREWDNREDLPLEAPPG